jgi:hypothetical protein
MRKDHVLFDLFGQDLDACVGARIEAYEQAKKKWANCSLEEWKAGADGMRRSFHLSLFNWDIGQVFYLLTWYLFIAELASKFGGLLDFVSDICRCVPHPCLLSNCT